MPPRLNVPTITRLTIVFLVAFTFLNATIQPEYTPWSPFTRTGNGSPFLTIIPGVSWSYPWVFATATLVEQNLFGLAVTGLTLFFGGRYLERAYGTSEYAKYLLFCTVIPNLLCFLLYAFYYYMTGSENAVYDLYIDGRKIPYIQTNYFPRLSTATISGAIALQISFLVSFKQLVPEHTVSVARGLIRMRVKHFPAIFLLVNTVSAAVFGTETAAFLASFGFLVSWTYLRFYRISPALNAATGGETATVKGDASDTFAFAYFFPEVTHRFLNPITSAIYDLLVTLRICTPFSAQEIESSNDAAASRAEGGLPSIMGPRRSGRREEAERRRALALAALDQRLNAAAARPPANASVASTSLPGGQEPSSTSTHRPDTNQETAETQAHPQQ